MSVTVITRHIYIESVLTSPAGGVKLSDPDGNFGVERDDNNDVVVADGTAMTEISTGVYQHSFTDPADDLTYTGYLEFTASGALNNLEITEVGGSDAAATANTLADIRQRFIKASRRYDLITNGDLTNNVDNGANWWINEGQRYLDRRVPTTKSSRRHMVSLAADSYNVELQRVIAIERLTFMNAADGRSDITANVFTPADFRREYGALITDWSTGTPLAWTANVIGLSPDHKAKTSGDYTTDGVVDFDDVKFGDHYWYSGILFYPKTDATYTCEIVARFYEEDLVLDTDKSFWTVKHPNLSVIAGCYCLERTMKSQAGMRTWLEAMEPEISDIDRELVEFEMSGSSIELEG